MENIKRKEIVERGFLMLFKNEEPSGKTDEE